MTPLRLLHRLFNAPAWIAFLAMGAATAGFALCSLHLFEMFQANYNLIASYGAMAVFDGGLIQFAELVGWGYLAMAFYIVFKGCLDGLLRRIGDAGKQARRATPPLPPP